MRVLFLAFVMLGAACNGGDPGGSSIGPGGNGGGDDGCSSHNHCGSLEFCYAGECDAVLDRRFEFTILDADVATTDPDGAYWDVGGGAPDLYVQFGFEDDWCTTDYVTDSFTPSWDESCRFVLPSGGTYQMYVYDSDYGSDDYAVGWNWEGSDALVALARTLGEEIHIDDDSGSVTVWFAVEPTF